MSRHGPLRVLHLAKYAPPARGGIETVVSELLAVFARRPDRVVVECLQYAQASGQERMAENVRLARCRTTAVIASAPVSWAMMRAWLLSRRTADVVHVHVLAADGALVALVTGREDVKRRTVLGIGALSAMETIRHELTRTVAGDAANTVDLDEWEAVAWEYGHTYLVTPAAKLINELSADFLTLEFRTYVAADAQARWTALICSGVA